MGKDGGQIQKDWGVSGIGVHDEKFTKTQLKKWKKKNGRCFSFMYKMVIIRKKLRRNIHRIILQGYHTLV